MLICICVSVDWYVVCLHYVYEWLMHHSMFYVFKVYYFSIICMCMFMFMGLDPRMIWCIVPSSSSVGGSGMLQCGIKALVAGWAVKMQWQSLCWSIWASQGHEKQSTKVGFLLPRRNQEKWVKTRKFTKFSKCQNVDSSKNLVTSYSDVAEHLVGRPPNG